MELKYTEPKIKGRFPPEVLWGLGLVLAFFESPITKQMLEEGIISYEDQYKMIEDKVRRSVQEYEKEYNIKNPFNIIKSFEEIKIVIDDSTKHSS